MLTYGVRWDVAPAPNFSEGPGLFAVTQVNDPANLTLAPRGTPLYATDYHDFAPRFGFAYSVPASGQFDTVVRGGIGLFWDIQDTEIGTSLGQTPPASATRVLANSPYALPASQQVPPVISTTPPFTNFQAFDPHLRTPYVLQYNLAVEQQFGAAQSFNINYVGSSGHDLARQSARGNLNSTFLLQTLFNLNNASSSYNALQIKFQRQFTRGFQVLSQYTWAKSLDDSSSEIGSGLSLPIPGYAAQNDRGPSNFDTRHLFSFAGSYVSNAKSLPRVPRLLLDGWSVNPLVYLQSARPVNLTFSTTVAGIFTTPRPDLVAGQPIYLSGSQYAGGKAINPAAFRTYAVPTTGFADLRQGTTPRNLVRGFGLIEPDLSVGRTFPIHEALNLQFRMDTFNVANHPNFGAPAASVGASNFGKSLSSYNSSNASYTSPTAIYQVGGPRSVQFSLKLAF